MHVFRLHYEGMNILMVQVAFFEEKTLGEHWLLARRYTEEKERESKQMFLKDKKSIREYWFITRRK